MNVLPPITGRSQGHNGPSRLPGHRSWREKFADAYRGMKLGVRGDSSFAVHFFCAALVVAAAIVFRCDPLEWCVLLACIGAVLVAELFNSAIEVLFRGLDDEIKSRCFGCLDISAGAVLLTSIVAAVIGLMIFLPRVWTVIAGGSN